MIVNVLIFDIKIMDGVKIRHSFYTCRNIKQLLPTIGHLILIEKYKPTLKHSIEITSIIPIILSGPLCGLVQHRIIPQLRSVSILYNVILTGLSQQNHFLIFSKVIYS